MCKHCGKTSGKLSAPGRRGLCQLCHRNTAIRTRYAAAPHTRHGNGTGSPKGERQLPASSTAVVPGSPAKILVLQARAQAGQQLWHPLDLRLDGDWGEDEAVDLDALPWVQARYMETRDVRRLANY